LRDESRYPKVFKYETEGAAADRAETCTLTGSEPQGEPEYRAVSAEQVQKPHNIDVTV